MRNRNQLRTGAGIILSLAVGSAGLVLAPAQAAEPRIVPVSFRHPGQVGSGFADLASIDAAGAKVAYLGFTDEGAERALVLDRSKNKITRVDLATDGRPATRCWAPKISDDGRAVIFSTPDRLDPADTNNKWDIYRRWLPSGTTTLVSVGLDGAAAGAREFADVSGTGRYVAFTSKSGALVAGDHNDAPDVFRRDLRTGRTVLISHLPSGRPAGHGTPAIPSISYNGRWVGFVTGDRLSREDRDSTKDVYLWDGASDRNQLVSGSREGNTRSGPARAEGTTLSPDGHWIAYTTARGGMHSDIRLWQRGSRKTRLVARGVFDRWSFNRSAPAVSRRARHIAYVSDVLHPPGIAWTDVLLWNRGLGKSRRISRITGGGGPAIDSRGDAVVFRPGREMRGPRRGHLYLWLE